MPPGRDPSSKADSAQAVIKAGCIGVYPFNSVAISLLHYNISQNIIVQSQPNQSSPAPKLSNEVTVGTENINLKGCLFNSFSDAFYRGQLPELVLVTCTASELPRFVEDWHEHVDKLISLGFLGRNEDDTELDKIMPQWVIASYGMVYSVLLDKLERALTVYNLFSARQKERLLQKFSRGFLPTPWDVNCSQSSTLTLYSQPFSLNVAGPRSMSLVRTTQVLEQNNISYEFNPNGELGILEWELHQAHQHIQNHLLPMLPKAPSNSQLSQWLDALALAYGVLPGLNPPQNQPHPHHVFSATDLAFLYPLKALAQAKQQSELLGFIEHAIEVIQPQLQQTAGVNP